MTTEHTVPSTSKHVSAGSPFSKSQVHPGFYSQTAVLTSLAAAG